MQTTTMKRTNAQNARFHALLAERKIDKEEKQALVLAYTGGRSDSSADMTAKEMAEVIKHLEGIGDAQMASIRKMRAKIINIAKEIFGVADMSQTDWDNLNVFLVNKFKGKLNELSHDQLIKAVTGMQGWKKSVDKIRDKQSTPVAKQPNQSPAQSKYNPYGKRKPFIESPWLIMKDRGTVDEFGEMYEGYHDQIVELEVKLASSQVVDMNDVQRIRQIQSALTHLSHMYELQPFRREN